ncbi:MAG: isoaspartyl peptidase/L-asparaginase [Opitutaceae bacterium]|nr:isoaspartyl peptidase/L-asparaginase [Opitutaceae bacterium]
MKTILLLIAAVIMPLSAADRPFGLVLHGGAGVIDRTALTPAREAEYRAKLTEAREAGYAVLERGGTALDAVIAAIVILEDSPLFNAGKGAVFTADGTCELDASIMDGRTQAAGAVAGVKRIKNPITLARSVMEKSSHVMLAGEGAEKFAQQQGFAFVPNEYFHTEHRRQQLEAAKKKAAAKKTAALETQADRAARYGTVGCVALDRAGHLAAGTSTGGMTNKRFGRVGDAPIIGAGTYAHDATCAISATGWGEYFIRVGVARDIAAQIEYRGTPLKEAAAATLAKVAALGGDGGVIGLDRAGNLTMPFNTQGMYRGWRLSNGTEGVAIFASP